LVVVGDAEVGEVIRAVVGGVVVEVGDLAALLSKVAVEAEAEAAAAAALGEELCFGLFGDTFSFGHWFSSKFSFSRALGVEAKGKARHTVGQS